MFKGQLLSSVSKLKRAFRRSSKDKSDQDAPSSPQAGPSKLQKRADTSPPASPSASGSAEPATLGLLLRAPLQEAGNSKGLLFGRPLQDCVRDTKAADSTESGDREGDGPAKIESRIIPALVLRCVQYLDKWGVSEEGLFRVAGRSTQIAKLRAEFDRGGDFDLVSCPPDELDPHAVSSIFKAFLRELPENILTRALATQFNVVIEQAKLAASEEKPQNQPSVIADGGDGRPRPDHQFEVKPPSVQSDPPAGLTEVEQTTARTTTEGNDRDSQLIHSLGNLITMLPTENGDLLLTLLELLEKTVAHSKTNKMPLSNLLLVFCPTLGMNPTLLRLLIENRVAIWDSIGAETPALDPENLEDRDPVSLLDEVIPPPSGERTPPASEEVQDQPLTIHDDSHSSVPSQDILPPLGDAEDLGPRDSGEGSEQDLNLAKDVKEGISEQNVNLTPDTNVPQPPKAQEPVLFGSHIPNVPTTSSTINVDLTNDDPPPAATHTWVPLNPPKVGETIPPIPSLRLPMHPTPLSVSIEPVDPPRFLIPDTPGGIQRPLSNVDSKPSVDLEEAPFLTAVNPPLRGPSQLSDQHPPPPLLPPVQAPSVSDSQPTSDEGKEAKEPSGLIQPEVPPTMHSGSLFLSHPNKAEHFPSTDSTYVTTTSNRLSSREAHLAAAFWGLTSMVAATIVITISTVYHYCFPSRSKTPSRITT